MGRKTPVASTCWGRGLAWWALQGEGSALPVPAGSLAPSAAPELVTPATRHGNHSPWSGISILLAQDKWKHERAEKAVHSHGSDGNVDRCRQGSQGCPHLVLALLAGTEAAARRNQLRLRAVAEVAWGCKGPRVRAWGARVRLRPQAPCAGRGSERFRNAARPVRRPRSRRVVKARFLAWIWLSGYAPGPNVVASQGSERPADGLRMRCSDNPAAARS